MENKNLEKAIISKINGEEEDTSLVINKGNDGDQVGEEKPNYSKPSSPRRNDFAIIPQETVAINSNNSTDPSIWETKTDHRSPSTLIKNEQEDKLKSAYKAKMGEVGEENERLKLLLERIMTDYQALQSQFLDILGQQETKAKPSDNKSPDNHHVIRRKNEEEPPHDDQLVSLSLGRSSRTTDDGPRIKNEMIKTSSGSNCKDQDNEGSNDGELALALGSVSETTKNSSSHDNIDDHKADRKGDDREVEPTEMWPLSKALKTARSSGDDHHNDEVSQTFPQKKARVSIRARCDAPTMNDGCQWRKYGQKIAKGNPLPRAYYRCTISPSCPVRKQVQRCAGDMSILISTYEGTHNHPLPNAATAMASTTSAAVAMLQSHSTTSSSSLQPATLLLPSTISGPISAATTSSNPNLPLGLNFTTTTTNTNTTLFQNSFRSSSPPQKQFYFPNTSISTSNSHPTITLDLTLPNPSTNHPAYPSHNFRRGISSNTSSTPRYSSTCLSFSSSSSINNHYNSYFNYRNDYPVGSNENYNKQPLVQEITSSNFYQPYLNHANNNSQTITSSSITNQQSFTETIAAATKAITSNPKFQSAVAAALTSFVGDGTGSGI